MSIPTLTQYQSGYGQVSGDQLNTFIQAANNVAALRTLMGLTNMEVALQGYVTANDGGQGNFYWNPTGTGPDDNGVTNVVPNGSIIGCWTRISIPVGALPAGGAITVISTGSTTARSLAKRFSDPENVLDFGADPTGVADSTVAIQAAMTAAGVGGATYLPKGTYFVSATLNMPSNSLLFGEGANSTQIYRTGNYGHTVVIGTNAVPARAATVRDIWFQHGTGYTSGDSSLNHLATFGAHIYVIGSQWTKIENCWLQRLPYQIYFAGGSWQRVERCLFTSTFDYLTPALQEGVANIYLAVDATFGNPTSVQIINNEVLGSTVVRNVTYVASDRSTTVSNVTDTIGAQYGIFVQGGEDLLIDSNYFGGMSVAEIAVINATNGACINHRIVNNFFDGISRGEQILYAPTIANLFSLEVTISNNNFIGGLAPILINTNVGSSSASAYNVTITGNNFDASISNSIHLNGCVGFNVSNNVVSNYNQFNVSLTDINYVTGILVNGFTSIGTISNNTVGGGGNTFSQSSASNFCYQGIFVDPGVTSVSVNGTMYAGIGTTTVLQIGKSTTENQYILTAAGNYQMTARDEIFIANKAAGAATGVALPMYPPPGREAEVIDGKGDASTHNITITTNDGTSILGGGTTINTNFAYSKYRFNGTAWNKIG